MDRERPSRTRSRLQLLRPFHELPRPARLLYVLVVGAACCVPLISPSPADQWTLAALWRVIMLGGLGITYSIVVRSPERVRRALAQNYCPNLQGIWVVAAGVALPTQLVPAIGIAAFGAEWCHRRCRPPTKGERYFFSGFGMVLATELARVLLGGSLWAAPGLVVLADLFDMALVLTMAVLTVKTTGEEIRKRLGVMFSLRSQRADLAAVAVGCLTGVLVTLPTGGIVLAMIGLPLLIFVQQWAMTAELEPQRVTDRRTGMHLPGPWLALAAENGEWPGAVLFVGLDPKSTDNDLDQAIEAIRAKLRGAPFIGHYAHGLAAIDPELDPTYVGTVAGRLEAELNRRGVPAIVEQSAATSGQDLQAALDDAVRVARSRLLARTPQLS